MRMFGTVLPTDTTASHCESVGGRERGLPGGGSAAPSPLSVSRASTRGDRRAPVRGGNHDDVNRAARAGGATMWPGEDRRPHEAPPLTRSGAEGTLGPRELPNPNAMSTFFYNSPVRCGCPNHRGRPVDTTVHERNAPCPFERLNAPHGGDVCCVLWGKAAAHAAFALGLHDLSARFRDDLTCAEALAFAEQVSLAADRAASAGGRFVVTPIGRREGRKDIVSRLRTAAGWYALVGKLGFGVSAWVE